MCASMQVQCIALARGGTQFPTDVCAAHAHNPTPEEFAWLHWANHVPKFLPPGEIERRRIARRDRQWWER